MVFRKFEVKVVDNRYVVSAIHSWYKFFEHTKQTGSCGSLLELKIWIKDYLIKITVSKTSDAPKITNYLDHIQTSESILNGLKFLDITETINEQSPSVKPTISSPNDEEVIENFSLENKLTSWESDADRESVSLIFDPVVVAKLSQNSKEFCSALAEEPNTKSKQSESTNCITDKDLYIFENLAKEFEEALKARDLEKHSKSKKVEATEDLETSDIRGSTIELEDSVSLEDKSETSRQHNSKEQKRVSFEPDPVCIVNSRYENAFYDRKDRKTKQKRSRLNKNQSTIFVSKKNLVQINKSASQREGKRKGKRRCKRSGLNKLD